MSKESFDRHYKLIPMHQIDDAARTIAVRWIEGYKPDGSMINLEQKHKLASDIMNYAKHFTKEVIRFGVKNNITALDDTDTLIEKYIAEKKKQDG